jgi:hypothetical protein
LIDEVKAIKADAERLQLEAEGRRDIRAALQAIRELLCFRQRKLRSQNSHDFGHDSA